MTPDSRPGGTVLARTELLALLKDADSGFRVIPHPGRKAVGKGSIDLRVGQYFLTTRRGAVSRQEASAPGRDTAPFYDEWRVPLGEQTVLHPGQLALAATLEYLALPSTLCGFLESRSTYGRMGLIAATATWVGPSYKGCPTLEIVNLGDVPIEIEPYTPLCQLILLRADSDRSPPSRYQCMTRPSQHLSPPEDPLLQAMRRNRVR